MKNPKEKVSLFIDAANYHYAMRNENWEIDFQKFINYFRQQYDLQKAFYYEGQITKAFFFDRNPGATINDFRRAKSQKEAYFKLLKSFGIIVRTKPISRVYDATTARFKHKCNFDVELTIDALDTISEYDTFILCSGDGDFVKLVKYLKGRFKKTVVVSHRDRISQQLRKAANQVIYLHQLRANIEKIAKAQP
ncbi:MAG: NYN domain-containing protein [Candidatus Bipolaricaulia bacterium]